jgi:excinuclease ABC subunit C
LRERAASALAYEHAAQIQGEIKALDWISSPQRVTTMDAARLTVAGWSGGLLVLFSIHGGRLCRWSQCTCSRSAAAGVLAATPAAWRDFTQRNAELAASLAQPR